MLQFDIKFTNKQALTYDLVVNQRKSVLVPAAAGSGKTLVAIKIREAMIDRGYKVICTSYTGKASTLLPEGTTVGRLVGMRRGVDDVLPKGIKETRMYKGVKRVNTNALLSKVDKRFGNHKLLICIDEVSQLSAQNLYLFHELVDLYRQSCQCTEDPIYLITGDFGQFSCIGGKPAYKDPVFTYWATDSKEESIQLPSALDRINAEVVVLDEVVRQADPQYKRALKWAYYGIALHPKFVERLHVPTPVGTAKTYFNNKEVLFENKRLLEEFLIKNPETDYKDYKAVCTNLTDGEVKHLSPVESVMRLYKNCPFTVTVNVPNPKNSMYLLAANGETVTIIDFKPRGVVAQKADGEIVELSYVQHYMPTDANGKSTSFLQLPGYPGASTSLYKVQGETFDWPMEFAAYQWWAEKRTSLRNQPGSVYVMCSRNTKIEDLYFDTSFGIEEAEKLLRDSISVNKDTLEYLLNNKPPLWKTDNNKKWVVVELESVEEHLTEDYTFYNITYFTTLLKEAKEEHYTLQFYVKEGKLINTTIYQEHDKLITTICKSKLDYYEFYVGLANTWFSYYHKTAQ